MGKKISFELMLEQCREFKCIYFHNVIMKVEAFLKCGKASCSDPSKSHQWVFIDPHLTACVLSRLHLIGTSKKAVLLFPSFGYDCSWQCRSFCKRVKNQWINQSANQVCLAWWHRPRTLRGGSMRQEDCKTILGYKTRPGPLSKTLS